MINIARNTGSCLGPKKNSGIKKNTICASEHRASSNQFAPDEMDPMLYIRNDIAINMLAKTVNPVNQNHARMYPPLSACRTPMISKTSRTTPSSDKSMMSAST